MNRAFEGIIHLYSADGFDKIQKANFLVVGIGGIGSWICESLVRSGALNITIVDLDEICLGNLNRQVHTLANNIGELKVDAMKERLLAINPNINLKAIADFFSETTKDVILEPKFDFVFDAIDSVKSKSILIDECKKRQYPFICIGGAGGQVDPTKIEIRDLNRVENDQLLFKLRKSLRKFFGYKKYYNNPFKIPTVFSMEDPILHDLEESEFSESQSRNCKTGFGSASFVTASFGFTAVSYALKAVTSK